MNPPLPLWYMCKYCMIPFFTLGDLNSHKEWRHSQHLVVQPACSSKNIPVAVQEGSRAENEMTESTNLRLDNKFPPQLIPTRPSIKLEPNDNSIKNEEKTAELYVQPQQQRASVVNVEDSPLDMNLPGTTDNHQNYSALCFDLSMLLPAPEPSSFAGVNLTVSIPSNSEMPESDSVAMLNEKRKKPKLSTDTAVAHSGQIIKQTVGSSRKSSSKQKVSNSGLHFAGTTSTPQHYFHSQPEHQLNTTTVNSDTNLYQCRHCSKQLAHKWSLSRHERKHSGVKRFQCQFCQKPIDDKCALQIHERTHTGERPFKCRYCESTFSRLSSSKRHEKAHLGFGRPKKKSNKRLKRRR